MPPPPHYKWRGHNNTNDPQKKYSLGTVSNNILLEGLNQFDPHFFVFNGVIQTVFVAFSMKTSRACTGMLSSENDDFKFLKTGKT